jgi:uroporphyrinogen-III synthase
VTVRVVVTTAADALPGLEAVLPAAFAVRRHPLLMTLPTHDPEALRRALGAGPWDAIACTSPRGATELAAVAPAVGGGTVWAVGAGTARALEAAGLAPRVAPGGDADTSAAAQLAAAMLGAGVHGRALVVAGDPHRPELAARLTDAGVMVTTVVVYRTKPVDDVELLAALDRAQLLVIGSPTLVAALAAQGDEARLPGYVALGATTADACRTAGLPLVAVAAHPSVAGVADAVRQAARSLSLEP